MKKLYIIIMIAILIVNTGHGQSYKKLILFSGIYGISGGVTEGLKIIDKNSPLDYSQYWHKTKMLNQVSGVVLGIQIHADSKGSFKIGLKSLLFSAAIYWIVHDIAYNLIVYPNKNIFYQSPNSSSALDKIQYFKPIVLTVSIIL